MTYIVPPTPDKPLDEIRENTKHLDDIRENTKHTSDRLDEINARYAREIEESRRVERRNFRLALFSLLVAVGTLVLQLALAVHG